MARKTTARTGGGKPKRSARKPSIWRALLPKRWREERPLVAVIRLSGAIGAVSPLRSGLSLEHCANALEGAFSLRRVRAVAIAVNSPGGSPVQSALIFRRIRMLAERADIPVYCFAEDAAASGGYMLACAGDEIYADVSSIIGSIGVVSAGFGFDKLIAKHGIERRVHTQGRNKSMLDPFTPEKADDVKRLKALQKDVHEAFVEIVRDRRKGKLKGKADTLFTGEFWSGIRALELGLIDGLGDLRTVMRDKLGDRVRFRKVGMQRGWLKRKLSPLPGIEDGLGDLVKTGRAELMFDLVSALEARALWARLGL